MFGSCLEIVFVLVCRWCLVDKRCWYVEERERVGVGEIKYPSPLTGDEERG
jgi:hypothetical protein